MQIKTTTAYHCVNSKWLKLQEKKIKISSAGEDEK